MKQTGNHNRGNKQGRGKISVIYLFFFYFLGEARDCFHKIEIKLCFYRLSSLIFPEKSQSGYKMGEICNFSKTSVPQGKPWVFRKDEKGGK